MKEPKIRFKGFTGEWETAPLDECVEFLDNLRKPIDEGSRIKGIYPYYGASGIVDYIHDYIFDEELILLSEDGANITDRNYPVCFLASGKYWVNNHAHVLRIKEDFVNNFVCNAMERKDYSLYNTGMAMPKLNKEVCKRIPLSYPVKGEQQAIADYFQNIGSLIHSVTKKIESLKQVKVASLQSMFPQEGETTPRVRFKGFEGEWDVVTLKECLTINNERNQSNEYGIYDVLSVSDEVGVANQIKLLGRSYAGKSVSNYRILKTNQIVYTKSPLKLKPYGIVKVNNGPTGIVSVLYAIYDAKENVCADYIHYYFEPSYRINNYLLPLINKGAKNTMNISDEMALTGCITIPSYDEQKKISEYLKSLDSQIALLSQQLEKLQQIKSACLDKMFV
jgi:type I restriction enzyme S subunit